MTPSIAEEDDYECAAAFLKEFHAGRVAALHPWSTGPLSAIREAEQENELAADFSMALSVRDSPRPPSYGDADLSASKLSVRRHQSVSPYMRVVADVPPLRIDGYHKEPTPSSRMKKTSNTKCLVGLCEEPADAKEQSRRGTKSTESGTDDSDDDFAFGYDDDAPASKRRCSM